MTGDSLEHASFRQAPRESPFEHSLLFGAVSLGVLLRADGHESNLGRHCWNPCGGRLRLIADPAVIRRILAHRSRVPAGAGPGLAPPTSGAAEPLRETCLSLERSASGRPGPDRPWRTPPSDPLTRSCPENTPDNTGLIPQGEMSFVGVIPTSGPSPLRARPPRSKECHGLGRVS